MLEIAVNGKVVQLLQPIDEVLSVTVNHMQGFTIQIDSKLSKPVAEWLYDLTQRAKNQIMYNGTILSKDQVNKPAHLKESK